MSSIFNIIVAALVMLIAYWWANQGVFSSILHFVCVACAGAMALALWEPVTVSFLLSGGGFDDYAWGLSLGGMFVLFLFLFRLVADKLAPSNLEFPQWANYSVGGAFGFLSGMLTMGITLISAGFIQSTTELGGFIGYARDQQASGAPARIQSMWIPVAGFTEGFYATLSKGALSPLRQTALAMYYPGLADIALSAHRDSYSDGAGKTSIAPGALTVGQLAFDPSYRNVDGSQGAYAVPVQVEASAFDGGEQFTLSSAQVRIISDGSSPRAVHPTQWIQPNDGGTRMVYAFDDLTNYASSIPGQQSVELVLIFPATPIEGRAPKFIQVKGLRLQLQPAQQLASAFSPDGEAGGSADATAQVLAAVKESEAPIVPGLIELKNSVMPAQLSANQVSGMDVLENNQGTWITKGRGEFGKGSAGSISRSNRIRGFFFDKGTQIVMLDVSRGQSLAVDVYDSQLAMNRNAQIALVDSQGNQYRPAGYVWEKTDKVELFFDSTRLIASIGQLPSLPSSGAHTLKLVFKVPEGSTIVAVKVGDTVVAKTNVMAVDSQADG
jgi:hypothetical protein